MISLVELRYTLLADGSSDRCLLRHLNWLIARSTSKRDGSIALVPQFADARGAASPPKGLAARIEWSLVEAPCDLLFVHRDSEGEPESVRLDEIGAAVRELNLDVAHVAVVPVTMTEAWLLFDESAIRRAADNPAGTIALPLPSLKKTESADDPKTILRRALVDASEKTGRRLDQFKRDLSFRVHRVAEYIDDFTPLLQVPAFASLEARTKAAVQKLLRHRGAD